MQPTPPEVFSKYRYKRYPLLDRLYRAGYTYNGLRRLLRNPDTGTPLAQETVRELLGENTIKLTVFHCYTIAGLLGCSINDVLDLIAHSPHKSLKTAEALRNGRIRHPDKRLDKRIFGHQLKNEDIPSPGWLSSL